MGLPSEGAMLALTDLSKPTRACVLVVCGGDTEMAEAVSLVLFRKHQLRPLAKENGVNHTTLMRKAARVRAMLKVLITSGVLDASDLIAKN